MEGRIHSNIFLYTGSVCKWNKKDRYLQLMKCTGQKNATATPFAHNRKKISFSCLIVISIGNGEHTDECKTKQNKNNKSPGIYIYIYI